MLRRAGNPAYPEPCYLIELPDGTRSELPISWTGPASPGEEPPVPELAPELWAGISEFLTLAAMSRVEQCMEIAPLPKPVEETNKKDDEVVKEQENPQLVNWLERLALPELCLAERLEIVDQLKCALSLTRQHAPPIMVTAAM